MEGLPGFFHDEEVERQRKVSAEDPKDIEWENTIQTLPWSIHLSHQKVIEAGLPSVLEQYDLLGDKSDLCGMNN